MLIISGIFVVLAIIGPLAQAQQSKDDRRLENNLSLVSEAINIYASKNKKLPAQLADIEVGGDAAGIVKDNLAQYKIDDKKLYRYQLCVSYRQKHGDNYNDTSNYNNGYDSSLSNYDHRPGGFVIKSRR